MDWKRFFDRLGMDGTRWQFRIYQWEERWKARKEERSRPAPGRGKQFKFCTACGAMLERDERRCPRCGARAPTWIGWMLRRTAGLVLPSWCPVSAILVLLNLANWLALGFLFGLRNLLTPEPNALLAMGALVPPLALEGEWFRLVTYGFLHIGVLHIGFNMLALSQVGPALEEQVKGARFLVVYLLTLIAGGAADLLVRGSAMIFVAGASGALFGLIGFGMSYGHFRGGMAGRMQRDFFLRWALYGFLFGVMVGADNIAHAGGFVAGAVLGVVIERERARAARWDPLWKTAAWVLSLAAVASFAWMIVAAPR